MSILNKKQKLESSLILSVSRSILIASYTYYLKQLNNLEHDLKIDIKEELLSSLKGMIRSPQLDQQVFDM